MTSPGSGTGGDIGVGLMVGTLEASRVGPRCGLGYLKVIEAKKFLVAVTGGERRNSTVDDAHQVAEVIAAASAERGTWQHVPVIPGATFGEPVSPSTTRVRS